jgi:NADPH:quinone reductase-like Zn-dependent oxidoreductase
MATMKAWQFKAASGPMEKNMTISAATPVPKIKDNEVLVENLSTALNLIDVKLFELGFITKLVFRSPVTPGLDVCGRIVEIGSKVNNFQIGDLVYGSLGPAPQHGALAQFVPIPASAVASVPQGAKPDDMVSIGVVGTSAYQSIAPYVKAGDHVFIVGGSGGTGVMAIQVAKALGCHVTVSTSTKNIKLVKSLGADTVLDYTSAPIVAQLKDLGTQFDHVFDNVGLPRNLYRASAAFLKPEGKYVQVGLDVSPYGVFQMITNNLVSLWRWGKQQYAFLDASANTATFEQLAALMKEGKLRAVVDSTFEFAEAPKAYEKLKTGRTKGRIVVHVQEP